MKTIAIIGGMGPQASVHAHKQLVDLLTKANKSVSIVHVSIDLEPFYSSEPILKLTDTHKELLRSVKADTGFIACNTVHHFFDDFQDLVSFPLKKVIDRPHATDNRVVFCSPTSKKLKLFGNVDYMEDSCDQAIDALITNINQGISVLPGHLTTLVKRSVGDKQPLFGCTEISLQAFEEGLAGYDTLQETIKDIVHEV